MRTPRSAEQRGQSAIECAVVLFVFTLAVVAFANDVLGTLGDLLSFVVALATS